MLAEDDLFWNDELPFDDPSELLRTMPEIRQYLEPEEDEGTGTRALLEQPEALSMAWWRHLSVSRRHRLPANVRKRRARRKARHQLRVLRAA